MKRIAIHSGTKNNNSLHTFAMVRFEKSSSQTTLKFLIILFNASYNYAQIKCILKEPIVLNNNSKFYIFLDTIFYILNNNYKSHVCDLEFVSVSHGRSGCPTYMRTD